MYWSSEGFTESTMGAGICALFESNLKEKYSYQRELTYDVQQLFTWMDHLVSALCHCLLPCNSSPIFGIC